MVSFLIAKTDLLLELVKPTNAEQALSILFL